MDNNYNTKITFNYTVAAEDKYDAKEKAKEEFERDLADSILSVLKASPVINEFVKLIMTELIKKKVILDKNVILQAGYKGQEVEFRIGGRLFAIREKAQ